MKWNDYIIRRRINNIEMWIQSRGLTSATAFCKELEKIGVLPPSDDVLQAFFPDKPAEVITDETNNATAGCDQTPTRGVVGSDDNVGLHSDGKQNFKFRNKRA